MWTTNSKYTRAVAAMVLAGAVGCGELTDDISQSQGAALGDKGTSLAAADFAEAAAAFGVTETVQDGLGPIFNERGCGVCHSEGAMGGAGQQVERRFGRFVNGAFDPLAGSGGSLRQLFSLGTFTFFRNNVNLQCRVPIDVEPSTTTVHNVGRLTTPVFGLGIIEALADSVFDGIAAAQPAAIRGTVNRGTVLLPSPGQTRGSTHVTRFGWKAGVPNLTQFSADAYLNEMGISTQSCVGGVSVTDFATENRPNRAGSNAASNNNVGETNGCPDDLIAGTDEPVGSCAGGLTEVQEDVGLFAEFMRNLAPPARGVINSQVTAGEAVFNAVGCNGCHVGTTFNAGGMSGRPFSDFLVHNMGTLGDQIGNAGDNLARTQQMRTAPLWGLRFRNKLLHDGRTTDRNSAIQAHDGQGVAARNAFNARSATDRANLLAFLGSL